MDKKQLEQSNQLSLSFDKSGLLPAIVQESKSGDVLMLAYINEEAFSETVQSGYATFWSRSRNELWKKGETSGNRMKVIEILVDCDQDCIILKVEKAVGGACHTKNNVGAYRNSCFYRKFEHKEGCLVFVEE